jgi:sec-independent protein translocase protein TatC
MRRATRNANKRDRKTGAPGAQPMTTQDTFISHLMELRDRLLRCMAAIGVFFFALVFWSKELYALLARPLLAALPQGGQMIATDVVGVFLVPIKVTALVAFVAALPYVLYQIWAFVAPGLYAHEKRLVLPLVVSSTALFLCGMSFAYFLVFPLAFKVLASFAPEGVAWMTDIDKYFSFVLTMFIVFGITFEIPVAVVLLVRMGAVTVDKLKEIRPYVIVGAFVIGAVFTPPDVVSQLLLAVPLWLLYELGIMVASMLNNPQSAGDARAPGERALEDELSQAEAGQKKE